MRFAGINRVRISAPPGVNAVLRRRFPNVSNPQLNRVADDAVSLCATIGVPLTKTILSTLCASAKTPNDVLNALEESLDSVPPKMRRSPQLLATRKFTIYSLLEASCPEHVRKRAASVAPKHQHVAVTVGAQILSLVGGSSSGGAAFSPRKKEDPFSLALRNADRFDFSLRQEAYCHRRLITDRALQKLARTNPGLAATHLYADSFGLSLRSRPKIDAVPYFFSAYYDFFQKTPDHFESLDIMTEVLAVTRDPDFRRLAAAHHANYVEQRDRWQDARNGLKMPRNEYIDPSAYARRTSDLTSAASNIVRMARSSKSRVVDMAVKTSPNTALKKKAAANELAWHNVVA